jgi:hypothetical protein
MSTTPPYPPSGEPPRPDAGGPYPGQPYAAEPHRGQPYPADPYPGQPYPGAAGPAGPPYPGGSWPGGDHPAALPDLPVGAMADPLVAPSFSDWWSKVIGVLVRSWRPLLVIQLATVVPGMVISAVVLAATASGSTALSIGAALLGLVGVVIVFVVALLAQAASIYVVAKQASGEVVGAGPALSFAAGRALPLLGWSILAGILVVIGFLLLVLPGLYLVVVFSACLTGVIMFERAGIGRTFGLVNRAFGQTLGRLLSFALAALVYAAITGAIVNAVVGREGFLSELLGNILTLPVTFAAVGLGVVTYATLRNRENPAVTTPVLAAELDRP